MKRSFFLQFLRYQDSNERIKNEYFPFEKQSSNREFSLKPLMQKVNLAF